MRYLAILALTLLAACNGLPLVPLI